MRIENIGEFEIHDGRFRRYALPGSRLEKLAGGFGFIEGPVWFADGEFLLFSDIPNDRMYRWVEGLGCSVFRAPSRFSNGNTRDLQGRLVTCEHGSRTVTRTELDGSVTVLADRYRGKRLNSPNDAAVKSDGSVWFTDPPYGILSDEQGHKAESEIGACLVFRLDPSTGDLEAVAEDFSKPNGIAFSPDERLLYVSDTGYSHDKALPRWIRVFDVEDGRRLENGREFARIDKGVADGFRLDADGNVWTSARDGAQCFSPRGELLGKVLVPETVANLTFGGPERNRLFLTASTSLYAIRVGARGAQRP